MLTTATEQHGLKLLIVDDAADNRALLTRCFERRGHTCFEAQDGREALELIDRQPFDLVLLDIVMPGEDGLQVLAKIRSTRPSSVLPVIMVSSKSEAGDISSAIRCGADGYVTKPVDLVALRQRVDVEMASRGKAPARA